MPSAYDDETAAKMIQWTIDHRKSYLESGGARGHIMDMSFLGGYRYEPMCLIRYVGRKSGRTMVTGLGYVQYGGEIVIVASLGGADHHPQWYLNIEAGGPLDLQIATQAFRTTWREPGADELEDVWTWVVKSNPLFGNYRKISKRQIPLIMMSPQEEIPVFTDPD